MKIKAVLHQMREGIIEMEVKDWDDFDIQVEALEDRDMRIEWDATFEMEVQSAHEVDDDKS